MLLERMISLHVKRKVLDNKLVDDIFREIQKAQELCVLRNLPHVGCVVNLGLDQSFNLLLLGSSSLDLREQVFRPVICREILRSQVGRNIFRVLEHINNFITKMSQIGFLPGFVSHYFSFIMRKT